MGKSSRLSRKRCDRMDLQSGFTIASTIAKERIYQGRKQKRGSAGRRKITNRTLWFTNLSILPFYLMISFFLGGTIVAGTSVGVFALLLLAQLFLSIMMTLNSLSTFRDLDLHEPLLPLPIERVYLLVSLSWLLSGGVALLVIPLPAAGIYSLSTGQYLSIPVSFLWGMLTVLFGHSIGLLVTNLFTYGPSRRSALGNFFQTLKIAGAFSLFVLWFLIIQYQGFLNPLLEPLTSISESLWFVYPFGASRSIADFSMIYLLSFALYSLLFSALYSVAGRITWSRIVQPRFAVSARAEPSKLRIGGKLRSMIRKDLTLSFRSGQRFLGLLVFPLMILFMNLFGIIQGEAVSAIPAGIVYLATAIASGWGISYLYIQEGESAWIMSALPVSRKEYAFQKALSAFSLFPLYGVPAILLVSFMGGFGSYLTLMQLLSAFAVALTSCLIVSDSLADMLPDNPTVITQETFGSRFHPLLILLKSAIFSAWPVFAIIGIYLLALGEPISSLETGLLFTLMAAAAALNLSLTFWRCKFTGALPLKVRTGGAEGIGPGTRSEP